MGQKFKAFVISALWTILPCFLSGAIVGVFFIPSFWYWMLGIAAISFPWLLFNRVPVRLYNGSINGKSFLEILTYGYASTDFYPKHSLFGGVWWSWYWGFFRRHF